MQRFQGEVNILEAMDHQSIVKLYEVFESHDHFYLIMDLLPGGELFDEIVRRKGFSEADAASVIHQLLAGLCYLSSKGFVHRDIKPSNIFTTISA